MRAIAKANGVDLGDDYLAKQRNFVDTVPPKTKSSMQMDLEVGRHLELDWMSGAVARIGDELGVPLPQGASTHNLQRMARAMGHGPHDSSSILRVYETVLGRTVRK